MFLNSVKLKGIPFGKMVSNLKQHGNGRLNRGYRSSTSPAVQLVTYEFQGGAPVETAKVTDRGPKALLHAMDRPYAAGVNVRVGPTTPVSYTHLTLPTNREV